MAGDILRVWCTLQLSPHAGALPEYASVECLTRRLPWHSLSRAASSVRHDVKRIEKISPILRFSDSWLAALKLWGLLSAARCRTRASSSLWSFKLGSADPAPIRHVWPQILICQEHEKGSHAWPVLSFALARYRIARHRANLLGSASRSGTPGISRGKKKTATSSTQGYFSYGNNSDNNID